MTFWEVLALMGIPSAITGIAVWLLKRWMAKKDKEREKRSNVMMQLMISNINATDAAISLGEATARAVQRIPDAHCNGDMHEALEYSKMTKHERRDLLQKLGVQSAVS